MSSTKTLPEGLEADLKGAPCPPALLRWLASLPDDLLAVLQTLAEDGAGTWLVGGCVRDAWLGKASVDIDLCTTCTPERMLTCLLYTSPSPRDRTRSRMPSSA